MTRERENVPSFYAVGIGVLSLFITTVLFIPAFLSYLPVHSPGAVSARQKPSLTDRLLIRGAGWAVNRPKTVMAVFAAAGCGQLLRSGSLTSAKVRHAAKKMMDEPAYNEAARTMQKIFGQYNSADWFNGFLEKTLH